MTKITYINFETDYKERKRENEKTIEDINEYLDIIKHNGKVYEILYNDPIKLFVDIDGVEIDKPTLINEFIQDFIDFLNNEFKLHLNYDDYALTQNNKSGSHAGLSYHVYIPKLYIRHISNIKYILKLFIKDHSKYFEYVDGVIYHNNRLFRATNQFNAKNVQTVDEIIENTELIQDIHILKHGSLKDTVIQYIEESNELVLNIDYNKVSSVKLKNSSFNVQHQKLKKKVNTQSRIINNLQTQLKANDNARIIIQTHSIEDIKRKFDEYQNIIGFNNIDKSILTYNQIENIVMKCEIIIQTKQLINKYIDNIKNKQNKNN